MGLTVNGGRAAAHLGRSMALMVVSVCFLAAVLPATPVEGRYYLTGTAPPEQKEYPATQQAALKKLFAPKQFLDSPQTMKSQATQQAALKKPALKKLFAPKRPQATQEAALKKLFAPKRLLPPPTRRLGLQTGT